MDLPQEHFDALKKQRNLKALAQSKADQAWANARKSIPDLIQVKKKLDGQSALMQDDVEIISLALNLILGELHLRKANTGY